jgi:uncharacterized FAD-dependent dehydrogenase
MQKIVTLRLSPYEISDPFAISKNIALSSGVNPGDVNGYYILKKSIDARGKFVWFHFTIIASINEPFIQRTIPEFNFKNVSSAKNKVTIIGGGPAGLFAALQLIELGIKPIIIERGKNVRDRRRDLAMLNRKGVINPESNYCFGEGGAGTFSDGKLYTRSTKRGNIERILNLFVHFGAEENILYEAHPHIGTNKLPQIITEMRNRIIDCGGEYYFNKKVTDFVIEKDSIKKVKTQDGDLIEADSFILATGHSARDIFCLLDNKNISILAKPFALGVRVEHPQTLINSIQYGKIENYKALLPGKGNQLPPASYSLVHQVEGRGVFSFCMCPGGIIAPASTNDGELVVNGWSPSKRNNPFANSGLVVQVEAENARKFLADSKINFEPKQLSSPLLMMYFQKEIEEKAFQSGGGDFVAPAQRMVDFTTNTFSQTLPECSYLPGIRSAPLAEILPVFISSRLKKALMVFSHKMPARKGNDGYFTNEAIMVATESRTSSPVRIPRDAAKFHHPQIKNLFPCGEGAGYAGGIVSAAMDGENVAKAAYALLNMS